MGETDPKASYMPKWGKVALLVAGWYTMSTALSLVNKKVNGQNYGAFPMPLMLTGVQFLVQFGVVEFVLSLPPLRKLRPQPMSWGVYMRKLVMPGVVGGVDIGLSNLSLVFITVSFYTMVKSTGPLFLLVVAFAMGLEKPSLYLLGVVLILSTGMLLAVFGETSFNTIGFTLVLSASFFSGLRWALMQLLLQKELSPGAENPLALMKHLLPLMSISLIALSLATESFNRLRSSVYSERWVITAGICAGMSLLALLMTTFEFFLIKQTSALTFMVIGILKEVVTVVAGVVFFSRDQLTITNVTGLILIIAGVAAYKLHKSSRSSANGGSPRGQASEHRHDLADTSSSSERERLHERDEDADDVEATHYKAHDGPGH